MRYQALTSYVVNSDVYHPLGQYMLFVMLFIPKNRVMVYDEDQRHSEVQSYRVLPQASSSRLSRACSGPVADSQRPATRPLPPPPLITLFLTALICAILLTQSTQMLSFLIIMIRMLADLNTYQVLSTDQL